MRSSVALAILLTVPLCAQQTASITGTVSDPTGAVVAGAAIKASNALTGESAETASNSAGVFTVPLLKPGQYELLVEVRGFKQFHRTGIILETGQSVRADVRLEVGGTTEQVTVSADAPLLKTDSSSVGNVVRRETIANMPLVGRRAANLARLSGFVVQNGTGSNFAIAGGRADNSNFTIDGGNAQNILLGVASLNFDPPIDSLEEFNVELSNFKAELGRTGGGMVQMTTRSGTNKWHGTLYEFVRNNSLDARNFFAAAKPVLRYNQFGGSFSGPIRRNRTFFFANMEQIVVRRQTTRVLNVPSRAEVGGQFNAPVFDPQANFAAFPANNIPVARQDPVGRAIANYYPAPNVAGAGARVANFRVNSGGSTDTNVVVGRVDHTISSKDRLYVRYLHNLNVDQNAPVFADSTDQYGDRTDGRYFSLSPTWTHTFTPTLIMEARYSYDKRKFHPKTASKGLGIPEKIGLRGTNPLYFPRVTLTGLETFGRGEQERVQTPIRGDHWAASLTKIRGKHTLKWGGEYRKSQNSDLPLGTAGGQFNFTNVGPGDPLAALLLGHVSTALRDESSQIVSNGATWGFFAQTDWKATSRLTLNLGLRYDLDIPRWESRNQQNSFNRAATNPACNCPGLITWSGRNGLSKYASDLDLNNVGPRVGFAWRVRDQWVVRGGGSLVFVGQYDQATPLAVRTGFSTQVNPVSPDGGRTPAILLRNGLPAVAPPSESSLVPGFGAVAVGANPLLAVEFFEPGPRAIPYMETFNLNVQRQLPGNMVVELGYLATLAHKLTVTGTQSINQVEPSRIRAGNTQILRPFPQFSNVSIHSPTIGNSNYHGGNLRVEKRYSRGLQFGMNFTWSKLIDDVNARNELGGITALSNQYNRRADRALGGSHISKRFVGNAVWELPFAKGNRVLGGWSTGIILEVRQGSPFGVIEANPGGIYPTAASVRSNITGAYATNPTWRDNVLSQPFFNTAVFAAPAQFTFGSLGRSIAIGPGAVIGDLSILKDFSFPWEGHKLQFRCEMLNFPNHANFALPTASRGNPAFGRVTGLIAGNQARIIQLGLHYRF
jgi:hypothetical protein